MRHWLCALLAVVMALASSAAVRAAEIEFEAIHTGDIGLLITLRGEVDGRPMRWLVDSASSHHLVALSVPARPVAGGDEVRISSASGTLRGRRVSLAGATAGGLPLGDVEALQVDLRPALGPLARQIDGVLGVQWLAGRRTTIDVARRRLLLDVPALAGGVPIERVQGLPVVALRVGADVERFLLDTGAAGAVVRLRSSGVGIDAWRLPALRLDDQTRREVPVVDVPGGALARALSLHVVGSVGMALLDGCRFTLDLVDQRLLLHACEREALRGGFGLQWIEADGRLVIARIWPGSPAADAGLASGDTVLSIGSRPAPATVPEADELLYRAEAIDLEVERRGDRRSARLERAYFLPAR